MLQPGSGSWGTEPLQGALLVVLYIFIFTIISEHVVGILKYGQVTQFMSLVLAKRENRFTAPKCDGFSSCGAVPVKGTL